MFFAFIIAIAGGFTYLVHKNFKQALAVLVGLLPLYLIRFEIGPLPTTLLEVLVIITVVSWLIRYKQWRSDILKYKQWLLPIALLLTATTIGVIIAPNTLDALGIWKAYFVEPVLLLFVFLTSLKTEDDWRLILKAFAICAIVLSLVAVVQYLTGIGIPAPWDIERRVTSIFDYPNALGLFLAPIVGLSAILYVSPPFKGGDRGGSEKVSNRDLFSHPLQLPLRQGERLLWLAAAVLGTFAIILAETEAAYVAIPAGLLLTFLFSNAPSSSKRRIFITCVTLLLVAVIGSASVRSKLFLQDYSGQVRLSQWSETIDLLKDRPVFGAGLNGYPTTLELYHDPTLYEIFQYPHNILLNTWVELGLLGVVAMIWIMILTVKTMATKKDQTLALAAFAGITIMVVHGLVDVPFFKNDLAILTVLLVAIIAQNQDRATDV